MARLSRIRVALRGHDVTHDLGAVTVLCGPNGAGKTTALEAVQLALTGKVAARCDPDRKGASRPADLAAAYLPAGGGKGTVDATLTDGLGTVTRTIEGTAASASVATYYDATPRTGRKAPSSEDHDRAFRGVVDVDALAWGVRAWLDGSDAQRRADLMAVLTLREPTLDEIEAAVPTDLRSLVAGLSPMRAWERLREGELAEGNAKRSAQTAVETLGKERTMRAAPARPVDAVDAALVALAAEAAGIEGRLGTHRERVVQHAAAVEVVARAKRDVERSAADLRDLTQQADAAEVRRVAADRRYDLAGEQVARAQALAEARDALASAEETLEDVTAARQTALNRFEAAKIAARDARDHHAGLGGEARSIETARSLSLCPTCDARLAKLLEHAVTQRREAEERAEALARTAAELDKRYETTLANQRRAEEAVREARGAVRAAEEAVREVHEAAAALAAAAESATAARSARDRAARNVEAARERLAEAERTAASLAPDAEVERLDAQLAGNRAQVVSAEAERAAHARLSALDAQIAEREHERDVAEAKRVQYRDAAKAMGPQGLAGKLLAEALGSLTQAADALYHAATGGRLRFVLERDGRDVCDVEVTLANGRVVPLGSASGGEFAAADLAISAALLAARGARHRILLRDHVQDVDDRAALLTAAVRLVADGVLHQVVLAGNVDPASVAVAGVTVIDLAPQQAREAA